jgi:predicted nucleotidyltransferase
VIAFREALQALTLSGARFVVIGGVALQLQGSAYTTYDLDIAFERTRENAERIAHGLRPFQPRLRGIPDDVPFTLTAQTLLAIEILTLQTSIGDVDLLAVVAGIGEFAAVDAIAETMDMDDFAVRVLSIDGLIAAKRAAGRPKDIPGLVELEAIREARSTGL